MRASFAAWRVSFSRDATWTHIDRALCLPSHAPCLPDADRDRPGVCCVVALGLHAGRERFARCSSNALGAGGAEKAPARYERHGAGASFSSQYGDGRLRTRGMAVEPTRVAVSSTRGRRRCSPCAKRKPERKGRAGFAVVSSRKKVPPSRKGTITIIPHARPRTSGASPCQRSADEGAHQRELARSCATPLLRPTMATPAAPTTVTAAK